VVDSTKAHEIVDLIASATTSKHDVMHVEHLPQRAPRKRTLPPVAVENLVAHRHRECFLILRVPPALDGW
jgi:hypothetical protein